MVVTDAALCFGWLEWCWSWTNTWLSLNKSLVLWWNFFLPSRSLPYSLDWVRDSRLVGLLAFKSSTAHITSVLMGPLSILPDRQGVLWCCGAEKNATKHGFNLEPSVKGWEGDGSKVILFWCSIVWEHVITLPLLYADDVLSFFSNFHWLLYGSSVRADCFLSLTRRTFFLTSICRRHCWLHNKTSLKRVILSSS